MLNDIKLENILFLDIETIPQCQVYKDLDETTKTLWDKKSKFITKEEQSSEEVYERAGIYSEFGKIICISVGYIYKEQDEIFFKIKSYYGDNEKNLLSDFNQMINQFERNNDRLLCAHNGKEFDFPYIARRTLINGLKLPKLLDIAGKKPWEIKHLDTMELWKFGDYKNYTSLELLTNIFNIPTPKDDINGSEVAKVYYEEISNEIIVKYCEKDVLAVAQLILRYKGQNLIQEQNINSI